LTRISQKARIMFKIALIELKQHLRSAFDARWRGLAGLAFMVLAMASIQYEEQFAPELARLNDGFSHAATDFSKKLASFTL
jgi:membrane protease subunit (stomatin/prohibitin family)